MQAAISASQAAAVGGNVAQVYIPTPETAQSSIPYPQLYTLKFAQPSTYIRSSSTVEDCYGCPYNMTEEDDKFLKEMNEKLAQRKDASTQCTEDQFEEAMNFFEETAKSQQPFSSMGEPPPILSWEDMQNAFDENVDDAVRIFAKDIYEHWKACREKNENHPIHPTLKLKIMDSTNDTDDNDPYVCFRRREVRQIRKTRGRDAQSVEKLKRLRRELEEARQLVAFVRQREITKKEQLAVERQVFEQRSALRECKRTLPEPLNQGDEELLINQKVSMIILTLSPSLILAATKEEASPGHHAARCHQSAKTSPKARRPDVRPRACSARGCPSAEGEGDSPRDRGQENVPRQLEHWLCRLDQLSAHASSNRCLEFELHTCIHRKPSYTTSFSFSRIGRQGSTPRECHR